MALLTDDDLHTALTANPNYISGLDITNWQSKDSSIQPCSVDLHIGQMFLPGEADKTSPGTLKARKEVTLATGQTAVIVTSEVLNFPSDWAAYGFPPSHVSSHGLLMTNPGHIDPGYRGNLRFTVINMSAEPFPLRAGDGIVTLLIHKLTSSVGCDYGQRTGGGIVGTPGWDEVNRLSKDFVNVEKRAKKIANDAGIKWTAVVTVIAAFATTIATLILGQIRDSSINDLKAKVLVLEERINVMKIDGRLSDLEKKLSATKGDKLPVGEQK
jgi:dCTP deaminase